ncbi:MAG TPA: tRNA (adenosine(37)-N6)-threonylcarbamoyltransferase complex ATPase subunit type 1 TsaE [Dermatophilaceae bacterium]|nr:tRNA (adenosine(37)-N6)-threonylcarbamoyltransferase complex ATPase subunit type 1 TsaE [Dermatophilaceae bacterium]
MSAATEPDAVVGPVLLPTAEDTRSFGARLATHLRPGDLVVLTGDLGAGKTTLTVGLGAGLGVRGPVTSPTFVLARVHPSLGLGPPLVHVDAYRLAGLDDLDALDLDASLEESVTVLEWGHEVAQALAEDGLEVVLVADPATEARLATVTARGPRWSHAAARRGLRDVASSTASEDAGVASSTASEDAGVASSTAPDVASPTASDGAAEPGAGAAPC